MKLQEIFFIDIETCLIKTKSGRKYPEDNYDWRFNDEVLEYIKHNNFDRVCLIADRPQGLISRQLIYNGLLKMIHENITKILTKVSVDVVYYPTGDSYFKYPYPGGILNYAIENDVNLAMSTYVTDNEKASRLATVGIVHSFSNFLLNG